MPTLTETNATTIQALSPEFNLHQLIQDKIIEWLRREANVRLERIDHDASISHLGLDSMGAAAIAAELETATGKTLNPNVVYELNTINELATYIGGLKARVPVAIAPLGDVAAPAAPAAPSTLATPSTPAATSLLQHYQFMNRRVRTVKELGLYFFEPEITQHDGSWVVVDGQRMLMLGSYEYLGLLGHPKLQQAAAAALEKFGTGHHGARLLAGTTELHNQLEARLARFMQTEDALVFSSGYVTNLATISTLVGVGDCIVGDEWNHASIADGCRLSGAEVLTFRHNDMDSLEEKLKQAGGRRTLVVVDAVFSMDGDIIDLPAVVKRCRKYEALLMVDEAHSLGVLGQTGRGIQEHFDMGPDEIDVKMGTLSKTLAGSGGFVAAREEIITYLRHHARGYIFSGALPALQAGVAIAALDVLEGEPQMVQRLWANVDHFLNGLKTLGFDTGTSVTPIIPVMTRTDEITLEMTRLCRAEGLMVIPVCFPAVPQDAPRLRTCISALHSADEIDFALQVLARAGRQTGLIP